MSRRNGSGSGSTSLSRAEQIASGRLRMDRNPTHTRLTDPSLAVGRRKEIDNVMKRARAASPGTWDRKLLEVEEKDPNRWRHTGYKQMYLDGGGSSGGSASPPPRRSRSRSPRARRSPPSLVTTTTPYHRLSRERDRKDNAVVSSTQRIRPETSQPVVSSTRDRERERERERERDRDRERERERERERTNRPPLPRTRPPSPPPRRVKGGRSPSGSSVSSCSDDSCSVCSVKKHGGRQRSRSRSFSVPRSSSTKAPPPSTGTSWPQPSATPSSQPHRKLTKPLNSGNANAGPSTLSLRRTASSTVSAPRINVASTKKPKPPTVAPIPPSARLGPTSSREVAADSAAAKKRSRDEKVLEWQRTQLDTHKPRKPEKPHPSTPPSPPQQSKERLPHKLKTRIKKEDDRPKKKSSGDNKKSRTESANADISPEVIAAALAGDSSGEDDSTTDDDSLQHQHHNENRLTLSERFGKMAQWSADRSNAMQNMRITRGAAVDGGGLTVRIEEMDNITGEQTGEHGTPPHRFTHSPAPEGHYPDELLASAPGGLPSWDDVRVRYDYYKKRGYLRGLTLSDYIKWEEWWYRYQQWLKQERSYERWNRSSGSSHRRRRGNSSQHSAN